LTLSLLLPVSGFARALAKMDATLSQAMRLQANPKALMEAVPGVSLIQDEPHINVFVEVADPLPELEAHGAQLRSRSGDIWIARLPLAKLADVASLPGVVRMEGDARVEPYLNIAVPEIRAPEVWNAAGWGWPKGEGVIAGMVDTSITLDQENFTNADGTSRVLAVWNFVDECNPQTESCGSAFQDAAGRHGTKVMGAMAGNGQKNCANANACPGAAPNANIVIAKFDFSSMTASDVAEGVEWIFNKAKVLGRPAVVNLSLGWNVGPRDGTSLLERKISDLSAPGRIIVAAAGNDSLEMGHAQMKIGGDSSMVTVTLECAESRDGVQHMVQGWYEGTVEVRAMDAGGSVVTGWVAFEEDDVSNDSLIGKITVSHKESADSGAKSFSVTLEKGTSNLSVGDWVVEVREVLGAMTTVDLWVNQIVELSCDKPLRFAAEDAVLSTSVVPPCTADNVICVGAYNTRCNDSTCNHPDIFCTGCSGYFGTENCTDDFPETVGDIASFSNHGPRRDGGQKPWITAPGQTIVTPGGAPVGICATGTSLSSPLVAGAVVLMLQVNPTLTVDQIRELLKKSARRPQGGSGWDSIWGWGMLDVFAAFGSAAIGISPNRLLGKDDDICFIATAAFGDTNAPQVDRLRDVRDRFLLNTSWGREFVRFYYRWSPPVAGWLKEHPTCALLTRTLLMPLAGGAEMLYHRKASHLAGVVLVPLLVFCVVAGVATRRKQSP